MENNRILLWVGISSILLIGGGLGLNYYLKNKSSNTNTNNDNSNNTKTPDNGANPPDNITNHTTPPAGASYPATPFKNTTEGNKFRAWVNAKYPKYAKANQLDPTGAYDNDFIRKAFLQYGAEYTKATTSPVIKLPASEFKAGDGIYLNKSVASLALYSYPENSGKYVEGTISRADALDIPIGRFVRIAIQGKSTANTWVKINVPTYKNVDGT
jgi:hypothetical protein